METKNMVYTIKNYLTTRYSIAIDNEYHGNKYHGFGSSWLPDS